MPDYQKGIIYKIVALNCEDTEQVYYGSTTQSLAKRMGAHRLSYKCWQNGKTTFLSSFALFENFGLENAKIILVQPYPCNSNYELKAKEAEYILTNKCLNKAVPNRTQKQWVLDNAEKLKPYYIQYRIDHTDKIKERMKQYRLNNADKLKKDWKQYCEDNKEKLKEKHICCCGGKYQHRDKAKHFRSKKHQDYILNNPALTTP